jgi:manganese transport protein
VQTRHIGQNDEAKRSACRYNLIDSAVALNGAMFVNIAILVMAAAVFFQRHIAVTEIQQAYLLLTPLLHASLASVIFAVALICSGQSSTLTGTLAGQVVMEGFLDFRMRPWLRRMVTRSLAIIPAALTIYIAGPQSTLGLLLLSQCILSMQLPFAIIPLIHFTSDRTRMGSFANRVWVKALAWVVAGIIIALNLRLAAQAIAGWLTGAGGWRLVIWIAAVPLTAGLLALLGWIALEPFVTRRGLRRSSATATLPEAAPSEAAVAPAPAYRRILAPLDHTELDRLTLTHAAAIARLHHAKVYLLHVEEGVTSQIYGGDASTAEVEAGAAYLERIARSFREQGIAVETAISHSSSPKRAIVRYAREVQPDLVIMGAHGHGGLKDLVFGNTINPVRHDLNVPMLIVRPGKPL